MPEKKRAKGSTAKRGFGAMDPETQSAIASKGGRAAHEQGVAHEFTPEEAREAGAKGGKAVAEDRAHMVEIGRRGGQARSRRKSHDGTKPSSR
ncbi:MAG TPA: KGG domain-containing protein [Polyangiaceae bacterium]